MTADNRPLTPQARLRRGIPGLPVQLADGSRWVLPYAVYARAYDTIRDRMYESIAGRGTVATADVMISAYSLLALQYDLSEEEAAALLKGANPKDLMETVLACLMGEEDPVRSYSNWVRSGLLSNGLKLEEIPPQELPTVIFQLVHTGRMVPLADFSHIELRKAKIASLLSQ